MSRYTIAYMVLTHDFPGTGHTHRDVKIAGAYFTAQAVEARKETLATERRQSAETTCVDGLRRQGYRIQYRDGTAFSVWIAVVAVESGEDGTLGWPEVNGDRGTREEEEEAAEAGCRCLANLPHACGAAGIKLC